MKMTFFNFLLICTFKGQNLADKLTNLAENLEKKLNPMEFMELFYSKSGRRAACEAGLLFQTGCSDRDLQVT